MSSVRSLFLFMAATAAISGMNLPCRAQTSAAPTSDTTKSGVLEEIVVTAEKRESNVQSTPIAITALSGDELQTRHVVEITGLGSVAPNVQMVPVSQTVLVNIRGVGSDFFDPRGESAVSSTSMDSAMRGRRRRAQVSST